MYKQESTYNFLPLYLYKILGLFPSRPILYSPAPPLYHTFLYLSTIFLHVYNILFLKVAYYNTPYYQLSIPFLTCEKLNKNTVALILSN